MAETKEISSGTPFRINECYPRKASVGRNTPAAYYVLLLVFSTISLTFTFWNTLLNLAHAWNSDEYSHAYILVFVVILMGWHRLTNDRPKPAPSWTGPACLIGGLALLFVAEQSTFRQLGHYGILASLLGISLGFLGNSATAVLAPAFAYLFFAIPLPPVLYNSLSVEMQLISSTLGVLALDLTGIPVFQEGNIIDLGNYKLQVAEACSGLRYLFPLMSFGFLSAYLMDDRWWKRIILFVSTIPITIGMNSLRIAVIGLSVNIWGIAAAEGFVHDFEGWTVFIICIATLMIEAFALMRMGHRGRFRFEFFAPPRGRLFSRPLFVGLPTVSVCALTIGAAALTFTGYMAPRSAVVPLHQSLSEFPLTFDEWRGRRGSLDAEVLNNLSLTDYWIADYDRADGTPPVNLYVAYYDSQRIDSAAHSPATCIPGGGWQIESMGEETLSAAETKGTPLKVVRLAIRVGEARQLVYYWFDERGRNITGQLSAKWYLLVDSITRHRTDGALVRLVTPIQSGESDASADARLRSLLVAALPSVKSFLPGRGK